MDCIQNSNGILESLMCPAFTVKDGMIAQANRAAAAYGLESGASIADMIRVGQEEYAAFTEGKLCIILDLDGTACQATVTNADDSHLFCLESGYEMPELRAFALAAQQLREPLSNAMASTDLLLPNEAIGKDSEGYQHLLQINKSLHQLLRAVSNMSDAASYADNQLPRMETRDAVSVFDEILEKAIAMASQASRTIRYKTAKRSVLCQLDSEKLERAIWNILSNAMKFSQEDSIIDAELRLTEKQLIFSVWDNSKTAGNPAPGNLFNRFLRQPGIEDARNGIGLGLSIVRSVAAIHGGTVLLEQREDCGIKITMSISLKKSNTNSLRSKIRLPIDYAGGRDHGLLELSDALPCELYNGL